MALKESRHSGVRTRHSLPSRCRRASTRARPRGNAGKSAGEVGSRERRSLLFSHAGPGMNCASDGTAQKRSRPAPHLARLEQRSCRLPRRKPGRPGTQAPSSSHCRRDGRLAGRSSSTMRSRYSAERRCLPSSGEMLALHDRRDPRLECRAQGWALGPIGGLVRALIGPERPVAGVRLPTSVTGAPPPPLRTPSLAHERGDPVRNCQMPARGRERARGKAARTDEIEQVERAARLAADLARVFSSGRRWNISDRRPVNEAFG
jgi:hypothetical protein